MRLSVGPSLWTLWIAVVLVLSCGCSRTRVLAGPGLDAEGLVPNQVVDSSDVNRWLRFHSARVILGDGSHSRATVVRIENGQVVWRPRDGNPFRKAPLRHKPLEDVDAVERVHRLLPALGGLAVGSVVGTAVAHAGPSPKQGSEFTYAATVGVVASVAYFAPVAIAGGAGAVTGGGFGFHDRLLLHPAESELEQLRRVAARRTQRRDGFSN